MSPVPAISYFSLSSTSPILVLPDWYSPATFSIAVCIASVEPSSPNAPAAFAAVVPAIVAILPATVACIASGSILTISGIAFAIGSLPISIAFAVSASNFAYSNPSGLTSIFWSVGISVLYVSMYNFSASLPNCSASEANPTLSVIVFSILYPSPAASSACSSASPLVILPVASAAFIALAVLPTLLVICSAFVASPPGSTIPAT